MTTTVMQKSRAKRNKKTIIHVNQHVIKHNAKTGEAKPVLTVKQGKTNRYALQAHIVDENGKVVASVVFADGVLRKPLNCGARVWIESNYDVQLVGEGEPILMCSLGG